MRHNKITYVLVMIAIVLSLTGCKNNNASNQNGGDEKKLKVNNTKNSEDNTEIINLLENKYWISKNSDEEDTGIIIFKINKDRIEEYDTYSGYYTTYKINNIKGDISKKMLDIDATAKYHDGEMDIKLLFEIISDDRIYISRSKDNITLDLDGLNLKQVAQLSYEKDYEEFDDSNLQEILGKTESELYDAIGIELESEEISSADEEYIDSRMPTGGAIEAVFSSHVSKGIQLVHDDTYKTKFGKKRGYLITLRSKGNSEQIDAASKRVFLDVESGNIYEYLLNEEAIKTDKILDTVNIKKFKNKGEKINSSENNKNEVSSHTVDEAKVKAIQTLESKNYYDSSIPECKMYLVEENYIQDNKSYYAFAIINGDSEYDLCIAIEKNTLEPIIVYSDGSVKSIDEL